MSMPHPFFYRQYPKSVRKLAHEAYKGKRELVIQQSEIPKPKYVVQTDGKRIRYDGP